MTFILNRAKIEDEEVRIIQDENPDSPRSWDNLGKIVCWHKQYTLPQEGPQKFSTPQEFHDWLETQQALVLPIYMYDHSGISVSTRNTWPYDDVWDAGQIGYIYVTHEQIKKEYSARKVTEKLLEQARSVLVGEIKTWDMFLQGDVWGYEHVKLETCDHGETHEKVLDSCWGFYGTDIKENGILENLPEKWKTATWENGDN